MKRLFFFIPLLALLFISISIKLQLTTVEFKYDKLMQNSYPGRYHLLVTHRGGLGEEEMAQRIKCALRKLDVECDTLSLQPPFLLRRLFPHHIDQTIQRLQPDIILSLEGACKTPSHAKQYIALTHGSNYYFSPCSPYPKQSLQEASGFLTAFLEKTQLTQFLGKSCEMLPWYTTCSSCSYKPIENFRLFYCGTNLAHTSMGQTYNQLFARLDRTGYFDVYGKREQWRHTPRSYRGFIKADGESILKIMHNTGVTLVLHAPDHFEGGIPNGKIFEAAAASTIIISDRHPFILREFGDSVLYIDQTQSPEKLFQEINSHMEWIRSHPEEARQKAESAHAIFSRKFTLETQLQELLSLHESAAQ